jgi:hypothetical protein
MLVVPGGAAPDAFYEAAVRAYRDRVTGVRRLYERGLVGGGAVQAAQQWAAWEFRMRLRHRAAIESGRMPLLGMGVLRQRELARRA